MIKKIIIIFVTFFVLSINSDLTYSASTSSQNVKESYTTLWVVDLKTFNEYRYKITEQYLELRNKFEVDWKIDQYISAKILQYANEWMKYLPDSLSNRNYYNYLKTSIEKWVKYPENSSFFEEIATSIENFLEKTTIQKITGTVDANPSTGNAPLNVTLRWNVKDPSWTKLENYNYTWWINEWWKRKVLWNKISLNYIFKEEWNYSVFLDVTSNHKNSLWYPDVLPFSSRADIVVKEKIASIILKVNNENLWQQDELKFLPDVAKYWLLFDATSSTPTSWSKFTKTEWDFWHWVTRSNEWGPKVERVTYWREGEFTVKLKLTTNENKSVERKFILKINNPIATIKSSSDEWYLWDKFTFTANPTWSDSNLTYLWKIIDIKNDKEILNKSSSTFIYNFPEKWMYNVQLYVTDASWNTDVDTNIIHINSRAPEAKFVYTIPYPNKPNTVFLDATSSFDSDFSDDWKLTFSWIINWERVSLDNPNFNGSNWYYTFSSIWDQSVVLEVTDPDDMTSQKNDKIKISSILSVEFFTFPRVSQIWKSIKFVSDSPEAKFYEWDFWDGINEWWKTDTINHIFNKSWIYSVKLKVVDSNDNSNTFSKNVYIWDSNSPYAFISIKDDKLNTVSFEDEACDWKWAYIVNRVDTFTISWEESMDVTWNSNWLSYSWKIGESLYKNQLFTKKFEDLWCTKVKLTVKSDKNWKESTQEVNIKVENLKPVISSLDLRVKDTETDPVIVTLNAIWSRDLDWVIQSYLWYYYTDIDPEPQDFRATKTDSTTFVLPKVTWNYYFVVVMKDNNEARTNSEELNGSKYFITLTWDNVNTPILDLKVNNNSVSIWDEVEFIANAENILWQNLNSKVSFSWDFDGDWFYDKETTTNTVTYKFENSWEKYAKVKVKYKWFSNTKTVTINVANILKPEFDYVSIWNDFVFFDTSLWNATSYLWDMWDWNKVTKSGSFTYTYDDWKSTHLVNLKISEWTKSRDITKKVVKNLSNFIKSRKPWLVVFSNQIIDEKDTITLEDKGKSIYFYLWSNSWNISNYVADFDIKYDSDLNWWEDDDEDNKFQDSYVSKSSILVDLNDSREQVVRLYTRDSSWNLLNSKDIKILKNYINESIDVNSITFEWVSDSVKLKLEKIKLEVSNFPKEHKLKWLMYIQKLKEEWNDDREKTNIIIEFEWFIEEINIPKGKDLIDLLESLLIEWENDKSEKSIAFNALKNLIPKDIVCIPLSLEELKDGLTCYDLLVSKLEAISWNSNIEENIVIWKVILENISWDSNMSVKQKKDFKAILNTFVYWSVSNIPTDEKEQVQNESVTSDWNGIIDYLSIIIKIFWLIIVIISWLIFLFFLYYKLTNKDSNVWFTQFISDKTSWNKTNKTNKTKVSDINNTYEDILSDDNSFDFDFNKETEKLVTNSKDTSKVELENVKIENIEEQKNEIPDWLKWSFNEDPVVDLVNKETKENSKPIVKEEKIELTKMEELKFDEPKIEQKSEIPDWLKWSLPEENQEQKLEEPKLETREELDNFTKLEVEEVPKQINQIDDSNLPDWLKWSFWNEKDTKDTVKDTEDMVKDTEDNFIDVLIQNNNNEDVEKSIDKESKKSPKSKKLNTAKKEKKPDLNSSQNDKKSDDTELWDDWMKIPDWLKTDDDK